MACYELNIDGNRMNFDDKASLVKYIRDNALYDRVEVTSKPKMDTPSLAKSLRQISFGEINFSPREFKKFQSDLLDEFIRMEDESQFFYKMGPAIALTKGLGKDFDHVDTVKRNLAQLGIEEFGGEMIDSMPIDVRYLLTGNPKYKPENSEAYSHEITANNIRIMSELDALSKTMFMERSPSFTSVVDKTIANLRASVSLSTDKIREIKDELSAFAQIAAYKQWISVNDKKTSTLRNSLIYDGEGTTPTIVEIANEVMELAPGNAFLQFILPVSTTLKIGKKKRKNIINRDLINTIEGKTRGNLEPDLIASLMDSFTELYQNPKTQFHAKALFDYLIVKDGLMFKNKSFIKMVPTLMFREMSDATSIATRLMAANSVEEYKRILKELAVIDIVNREGNFVDYFTPTEKQAYNDAFRENDLMKVKNMLYNKVFGTDYNGLYDTFESIYATDAKYQYNLDLVRTKIRNSRGIQKFPDGIQFAEGDGNIYMHVALFTDKLKKLEKGSEARKEYFKESLDEIGRAGFAIADQGEDEEGESKLYLNFKKFVRVKGKGKDYDLYQLIAVDRDGKRYQGASMTAEGESIPRGVYGVYRKANVVGTSNSTGAANLGPRPTKEQILKNIEAKIKRDDKGKNPPPPEDTAPPTTPAPTSPQPPTGQGGEGTTITSGIFGGLQQLPYDEGDVGGVPLGFFNDEQVNEQPC